VDPYYPNHLSPPAPARATLRRMLDFGVAFRGWLRGPELRPVEPAFMAGPAAEGGFSRPHSARPQAGRIWARVSVRPGWTVLSLVNLLRLTDASWDRPQPPARAVAVTVTLPRHLKKPSCWAASPDAGLKQLAVAESADGAQITVPLRLWSLIGFADNHVLAGGDSRWPGS